MFIHKMVNEMGTHIQMCKEKLYRSSDHWKNRIVSTDGLYLFRYCLRIC